jgi:pyruvate/2-oxoglutarate dehydrogenase complex dihydrolipoamide dehydrogenase (E3) component
MGAPQYFPYGIYAVPEISTVGMSEQEVRERASSMNAAWRGCGKHRAAISWGWSRG